MAGQARYKVLADTLRRDIAGGAFRDGGFPTEAELCSRFKVSRFTVREALRELKDEGLIARRRGSGTTIRLAAIRGGALHQPLTNVGEILQYAQETSATFALVGEGGLPDDIADQIGMGAGSACLRIIRCYRDGAGQTLEISVSHHPADRFAYSMHIEVEG